MLPIFRTAVGAAIVVLALVLVIAIGLREAQSDPVVRRVTIAMRGMPTDAPPLRVALISDIHIGNRAMPVARLSRIVDQINAQHPDAVLMAGDMVNGLTAHSWDFHPGDLVAPLSRLRTPLGVIAVLGNHDVDTSAAQVDAALARAGVTVLQDQAMRLGPIALIGVSRPDFMPGRLPPLIALAHKLGGPLVLMLHPPPFAGVVSHQVPVILAGHSHCGQIVFPGWDNSFDFIHWAWRYPPQTRCGLVRYDHHLEIVTAGLGAATAVPLRINAPPDFWMITFVGQR